MSRLAMAILMALCAFPLRADIDESAYEAVGAVRGERERQRLRRQFAAESEMERRRLEEGEAALARAMTEMRAKEAARPYPERLTEQQCTLCHPAENFTTKRHTWLYWRLVVARMVWLNDAPIPAEAQPIVVEHLATAYPARGEDIIAEYGLPALALLLLTGAAWTGHRLLQGRR